MNDNPGATSEAWYFFEAVCGRYTHGGLDHGYPFSVTIAPDAVFVEPHGPVPWARPVTKEYTI